MRGDRTIDQMVQAARSGKQNIIEGCKASATSAEMEIKLIGVAKARLHELRGNYEDYLRNISYTDPVKGRIWENELSVSSDMMRGDLSLSNRPAGRRQTDRLGQSQPSDYVRANRAIGSDRPVGRRQTEALRLNVLLF
jgi:hypothetical protein